MRIPQSVHDLIATGPVSHLTTINPDGSAQVSVVWVGIEDDAFVFGHIGDKQKLRNIARDPRIALSLLSPTRDTHGLQHYLVAYGTGTLTDGGAADLLQRLAHVYLGPGVEFPPAAARASRGTVLHLKPERLSGNGPWVQVEHESG